MFQYALKVRQLFLGLCISVAIYRCHALDRLPYKLRVESEVIHMDSNSAQMYASEEIIDRLEGSVRVTVSNMTTSLDRTDDMLIYYRLNELSLQSLQTEQVWVPFDDKLVAFQPKLLQCRVETTHSWYLQSISWLLFQLFELESRQAEPREPLTITTEPIRLDRTLVGPAALLEFVHLNGGLFRLEELALDEVQLCPCYYFATDLLTMQTSERTQLMIKFVYVIPETDVVGGRDEAGVEQKPSLGAARLSQVEVRHGASTRLLAVHHERALQPDSNSSAADLSKVLRAISPTSLLDYDHWTDGATTLTLNKLLIAYTLVQEFSLARQSGLRSPIFDPADSHASSPFCLPKAAACAKVSQHQPLAVLAKQFSCQFRASDRQESFYLAFDEPSAHLRYDSIGEHKIVYSLNEHRATIISAPPADSSAAVTSAAAAAANESATGTGASNTIRVSEQSNFRDQSHCGQLYLDPDDVALFGANTMESVLGLGQRVSLFFLGSVKLAADGLDYLLFEREINFDQVPLVARLHLRTNPTQNSRLFLNFYFTNERDVEGADQLARLGEPNFYSQLNLRRLELWSLNHLSKYKYLNSLIELQKFSWSLETERPSELDERSSPDGLPKPAQTFDTGECKPASEQTKLELLVSQLNASDWAQERERLMQANVFDLHGSHNEVLLADQLNSVEESLMQFLVKRTSLPRSAINGLEVQALELPAAAATGELADNQPETTTDRLDFLVEARLSAPLAYSHAHSLVGWILNYDPLVFDETVTLIKQTASMLRHECSLRLMTQFAAGPDAPSGYSKRIHMVHCPNDGCGYVRGGSDQLDELNLTRADGDSPSPRRDVYIHLCEVYRINREPDPNQWGARKDLYGADRLRRALANSRVMFDLAEAAGGPENLSYRGMVGQLALLDQRKPGGASWDRPVVEETCYSANTSFAHQSQLTREFAPTWVVQFVLAGHQSQIHCHKACQMLAECRTYTYNRVSRECSLANIPADLIATDKTERNFLESLQFDLRCSLFALNANSLYKANDQPRLVWPSFLLPKQDFQRLELANQAGQQALLVAESLEECAQLCRLNDSPVSKGAQCRSFSYSQGHRLCSLELVAGAKHSFAGEPGASFRGLRSERLLDAAGLEKLLGLDRMSSPFAMDLFRPDYGQFYAEKQSTRVELLIGGEAAAAAATTTTTERPLEDAASFRGKHLESVELEACLRECTLADPNCLMVNYCNQLLRGRPALVKSCQLYRIRSPFSLDENFSEKVALETGDALFNGLALSELEAKFYAQNKSERHQVRVSAQNCRHFYLTGDYLALRRRLAGLAANQSASQAPASGDDEQPARKRTPSNTVGQWPPVERSASSAFVSTSLQLIVGLLLGGLAFIYKPELVSELSPPPGGPLAATGSLVARASRFARSKLQARGVQRERSLSQTEMVDIAAE